MAWGAFLFEDCRLFGLPSPAPRLIAVGVFVLFDTQRIPRNHRRVNHPLCTYTSRAGCRSPHVALALVHIRLFPIPTPYFRRNRGAPWEITSYTVPKAAMGGGGQRTIVQAVIEVSISWVCGAGSGGLASWGLSRAEHGSSPGEVITHK